MNFKTKLKDSSLNVDLSGTKLKDVLQYCKPKEQLVLVRKYALWNHKKTSLQQIGREYGLTRERVRQIEAQGLSRFRRLIMRHDKYLKVIEDAKLLIKENEGIMLEDDLIAQLVRNNYWLKGNEIKLVLVSDFDLYYLKRNRILKKSFYIEPLYESLLTQMGQFVLDYFGKKQQSEDLYEFVDRMKDVFSEKHPNIDYLRSPLFYKRFLSFIKWVVVFDGKVWLGEFDDVNPKTIKAKMIYVLRKLKKPLHYQEMTTKIMEMFPGEVVKVNTVHNELVKNGDIFVNMGLGLYGLREWGIKWGTVKDVLVRIMKEARRPMNVREIIKEVSKEKIVSPNTVVLNLQRYPELFERKEKWVYEYVGD